MRKLIFIVVFMVCAIEYGRMAVDSFYKNVNAEIQAFQQNVIDAGEY